MNEALISQIVDLIEHERKQNRRKETKCKRIEADADGVFQNHHKHRRSKEPSQSYKTADLPTCFPKFPAKPCSLKGDLDAVHGPIVKIRKIAA